MKSIFYVIRTCFKYERRKCDFEVSFLMFAHGPRNMDVSFGEFKINVHNSRDGQKVQNGRHSAVWQNIILLSAYAVKVVGVVSKNHSIYRSATWAK